MTGLCAILLFASISAPSELYPASLWVVLRHDVVFLDSTQDLSELEWPDSLLELGEVVGELEGVSGYASRRSVRVQFSGADEAPEWYDGIATRVRQIPGVLDAACLPPVLKVSSPAFVTEEVAYPEPIDQHAFRSDSCGDSLVVFLDIVVDTNGNTRDPVFVQASGDVAPECLDAMIEWVGHIRWRAARRLDGPVPVAFVMPVRVD